MSRPLAKRAKDLIVVVIVIGEIIEKNESKRNTYHEVCTRSIYDCAHVGKFAHTCLNPFIFAIIMLYTSAHTQNPVTVAASDMSESFAVYVYTCLAVR